LLALRMAFSFLFFVCHSALFTEGWSIRRAARTNIGHTADVTRPRRGYASAGLTAGACVIVFH
jgi:hypothetical protein